MEKLRNLLKKLEEVLNITNSLIKENQELKAQIEVLETEKIEALAENKELKEQIEVLVSEKAEIVAENEQLKAQIEEMKQEVVDQELVNQLNAIVDELVALVKEA